jgi:hypothetical protein
MDKVQKHDSFKVQHIIVRTLKNLLSIFDVLKNYFTPVVLCFTFLFVYVCVSVCVCVSPTYERRSWIRSLWNILQCTIMYTTNTCFLFAFTF